MQSHTLIVNQSINESIKWYSRHSVNDIESSKDQSINRSINQSINRAVSHPDCQSINQLNDHAVSRTHSPWNCKQINQSIAHPCFESINRSIEQPIDLKWTGNRVFSGPFTESFLLGPKSPREIIPQRQPRPTADTGGVRPHLLLHTSSRLRGLSLTTVLCVERRKDLASSRSNMRFLAFVSFSGDLVFAFFSSFWHFVLFLRGKTSGVVPFGEVLDPWGF